ncbi:hypothetical protein SCP_0110690 [Sparassis crispa]|uniref:MIT domain-containing protein n=1 Tax=Sparassis crispa TaxID=139825 RepID=A0A401G7P2_9APHY|nr:hypothetical protein SCP_0110690 [Sparassis crispa]GBE78186.1 hypothetical protein SCP_0110690 [Sparassis crispa]
MELDWNTRPLSIVHKSREWHPMGPNGTGPSVSSSTLVTRRRSTVLHTPPGPPPSQPIPNVPALPATQYATHERRSTDSESAHHNGTSSQVHPYTRPAASANLAAVAAFSQARLAAASSSTPSSSYTASSSTDNLNLSDSPPVSVLRSVYPKPSSSSQTVVQDRSLLSPPDTRPSSEPRPSSRRALTKALELAREAVRLDSTNDDPHAAVVAYGQSVALLSEVMARVMRGEDGADGQKRQNGRRRSVVAQEEEVRRLKSIHDTYADRMNILSLIYSIPLPPFSPPSTYTSSVSASTESTQPPSPTSPTSETSDAHSFPSSSYRRNFDGLRPSLETARADDSLDEDGDEDAIGVAIPSSVPSSSSRAAPIPSSSNTGLPQSAPPVPTAGPSPNRHSIVPNSRPLRPRASSTLPPPAPPPTTMPPPAPPVAEQDASVSQLLRPTDVNRTRAGSVSHKRTSSGGRLAALHEDVERREETSTELTPTTSHPQESKSRNALLPAQHDHPLPPLPSPSLPETAITPRNPVAAATPSEPSSAHYPAPFTTPRPRGDPSFSAHSDMATPTNKPPLINTSPLLGTISQRRTKASAPPSTGPSSPTDSTTSAASVPAMRLNALPASTVSSLAIVGRNRASSQPGRRPSVVNTGPHGFPTAVGAVNGGPVPRKASIPSRLNPNVAPSITVNTALLSPPLTTAAMMPLVPPPPIPYGNIPTAPLSPLPSLAPPDPLRKPYHMMTLLRQTMTSKTGGYVTRRLHVPQEVWSQGGAKLTNIPEKIRVVEVLCSALEEVHNCSVEYFGAGNVSSGMVMGIGSIGRKEGEAWAAKLEEFSNVCDGVVSNFGKKLGVGEGFVTKKSSGVTSWGGKLTRQFDKFTNGKNLDSPAIYVQGLSKLFHQALILDEHTKAALSHPMAPLYAGFPIDVRTALEMKLRRASEFFAKVVLTFVIRDMALLLDKYVKKCEKWLAE